MARDLHGSSAALLRVQRHRPARRRRGPARLGAAHPTLCLSLAAAPAHATSRMKCELTPFHARSSMPRRSILVLAVLASACGDAFERGEDPILPESSGECPQFMSGTQTIAGLETSILAGAPTGGGALVVHWHGTGGNASDDLALFPQA